MTVYYAPGGGRGHVTRARRVLERLGIHHAVIVATSASGPGVVTIPPSLEGDVARHAEWLQAFAGGHFIVDTFPAGIQGELEGLAASRIDHVARLLRWDEYRKCVPQTPPPFDTTFVVEPLTAPHDAFVHCNSVRVEKLDLRGAGAGVASPPSAGYWLIVHSGPAEEVRELVAYAEELLRIAGSDPEVLVATPCPVELPAGFRRVSADPATPLYPGAARIITAAGFNVMLETEPHRERHSVLPFPRKFDDQFLRAARRAGRTASGSVRTL